MLVFPFLYQAITQPSSTTTKALDLSLEGPGTAVVAALEESRRQHLEVIMSSPISIRRVSLLTFFLLLPFIVLGAMRFLVTAQSDTPPQANPDSYCASPGAEMKITAARGVLANDTASPLTIVPNP